MEGFNRLISFDDSLHIGWGVMFSVPRVSKILPGYYGPRSKLAGCFQMIRCDVMLKNAYHYSSPQNLLWVRAIIARGYEASRQFRFYYDRDASTFHDQAPSVDDYYQINVWARNGEIIVVPYYVYAQEFQLDITMTLHQARRFYRTLCEFSNNDRELTATQLSQICKFGTRQKRHDGHLAAMFCDSNELRSVLVEIEKRLLG